MVGQSSCVFFIPALLRTFYKFIPTSKNLLQKIFQPQFTNGVKSHQLILYINYNYIAVSGIACTWLHTCNRTYHLYGKVIRFTTSSKSKATFSKNNNMPFSNNVIIPIMLCLNCMQCCQKHSKFNDVNCRPYPNISIITTPSWYNDQECLKRNIKSIQ